MVPEVIQHSISNKLNLKVLEFSPSAGGCISNGGKLTTSEGDFFLKWNSVSRYPGMFKAEENGLKILRKTNTIHLPKVVLTSEVDSWQYIMMEFIAPGMRTENYWELLGFQLAELHKHSHENFGLDHDNYIGSLNQINTPAKKWVDFFIQCRLEPQIKMLRNSKRVDVNFINQAESLYLKLTDLIPEETPSLLHGDLWRGNVIQGRKGPVAIDPAVYYGNREAEIAFTRLFGGFENSFYDAYERHFPLQVGFRQRADLFNLYPLLVHANLFGESYLSDVVSILNKYSK